MTATRAVSSSSIFARAGPGARLRPRHLQSISAGDAEAELRRAPAGRVVEATYRVPFLHHATMEPINATAQLKDGKLTVWAGEQDGLGSKAALASWIGLGAADIRLVPLPVGGAFGRRMAQAADYLEQAARIAMAMAPRPVKMIWSREEDFAQGTYRPALTTAMRGRPWARRPPHCLVAALRRQPRRRIATTAYAIPYAGPQPVDPLRAAAHPTCASAPGAAWRTPSTASTRSASSTSWRTPRARTRSPTAVISSPPPRATAASWRPPPRRPAGARPLPPASAAASPWWRASAPSWPTSSRPPSARAARPRVHRVTTAVDCGTVCHPDTAAAQVEGAIVMGLSAAIAEEITIDAGAVAQRNFPDYPLLTLAQTPPSIDVHFLESDAPWGGLGEPGLPPVAPALANALFAATGRRLRTLPLADRGATPGRRVSVYFAAVRAGSLTFSILSNSTLRVSAPAFSTRRM